MQRDKKLGLRSVVSTSVGLVVATSCLVSLGSGAGTVGVVFIIAMVIACAFNMISMASMAELNALMPDVTGGLAQYTLAAVGPWPTLVCMVGGYILSSVLSAGVEASIFSYAVGDILGLPIPNVTWSILITVILLITNLKGVDMFARVQDLVVYLMLGSMLILGLLGVFELGTGEVIVQPAVMAADFPTIASTVGTAFWLFIGAEYAIPISKDVRNASRNIPLGMFIGLAIICAVQSVMVLGFHNYTTWSELRDSAAPHLLYGMNLLGYPGKVWMTFVAAMAVISTQNSSVNALASICEGMAEMNLLPRIFGRTNRHGVPFVGVWFVSACILVFAFISNDSADTIERLILVASIFWMVSYIFAHIDVLVFRYRLPDEPRSFRVPGGLVLPVIGIVGTAYMIAHIAADPVERARIWMLTGIVFLLLTIYSLCWIRLRMHIPVLRSVPLREIRKGSHSTLE